MTPSELLAVGMLLTLLESTSFRTREDAYRSLDSMGQKAVPAMIAARPAAGRDAQQKLTSLIDKRHGQWWAAVVGTRDKVPWIDALPDDYPCRQTVISLFLDAATAHAYEDFSPPYPRFRCATILYAQHLIDEGVPWWEVAALMQRLQRRCRGWDGTGNPPKEAE